MSTEKPILNIPKIESVEYSKNVIDIAVCEMRFPTILDLETSPPTILQKLLRKEYPLYEVQERAEVRNIETLPGHFRYMFYEKKKRWTVCVQSTSILLETKSYTNFEDFEIRLKRLLEASRNFIDSDFFTRVGLRYVNNLPVKDSELTGWINENLLSSYNKGVYGYMDKYESAVQGFTDCGKYTFRHGLKDAQDKSQIEYILDFDYFNEDVPYDDVISLVKKFNEINFSFFNWAIGSKTIEYMGKTKLKKGK